MYYIDHKSERTQWLDPRLEKKKHVVTESKGEGLPHGWEKIDDPQYGTYYIDHINRRTQFESPVKDDHGEATLQNDSYQGRSPQSKNSLTRSSAVDSPGTPHRTINPPDFTSSQRTNGSNAPGAHDDDRFKFTNNPDELVGERYTTHLVKGKQGFGFTIIGGDDPDEFLQIRNILHTGPAHQDGILQTGDVLVAVNKKLVLGCTHQDVVTIFQGIDLNERVKLEVCRGYPLPFDPADPKAHIVTSYAIDPARTSNFNRLGTKSTSLGNMLNANIPPDNNIPNREGPAHGLADDTGSRSSYNSRDFPSSPARSKRGHGPAARRGDTNLSRIPHVKSLPDLSHKQGLEVNHQRAKTPTPSLSNHPGSYGQGSPTMSDRMSVSSDMVVGQGPPETHSISFIKGNQGFGFTVADSPYGQKVKQILAPQRCKTLREGDILVEINHESITDLLHAQVVQKLKDCPQGMETIITVKRGGLLRPVRGQNKLRSPKALVSQEDRKPEENRFNDLNGSRQDAQEEDRLSVDSDQKRKTDVLVDEMRNELKHRKPSPNTHDKRNYDSRPVNGDGGRLANNVDWDSGSDKQSDRDRSHHDREVENYNSNKGQHRGRDWHEPRHLLQWIDRPHSRAELDRRAGDRLPSETIPRPQSSRPDQGGRYMNGDWSGSLDRRRPPDSRRSVDPLRMDYDRRGRPGEPGYTRDFGREPSETDWSPELRRQGQGDRSRRPPDDRRRPDDLDRRGPSQPRNSSTGSDRDDRFIESTVFLKTRDNIGFGFRIIGGHEEGSQVSIGAITTGGVAAHDGRLVTGDELLYVDGKSVVGSSHKKVVSLMISAGKAGRVSLGIRRRASPSHAGPDHKGGPHQQRGSGSRPGSRPLSPSSPASKKYPYDVKLHRRDNEGFGFVVLSSTLKSGSNIGRIIEGSPADRCRDLEVGDRIVAINAIDICSMHHKDIVNMIKDTGTSVTLTIGTRGGDEPANRNSPPKNTGHMLNALAMPAQIKGSDGSLRAIPGGGVSNHHQPMSTDHRQSEPIYAKSSKWKTEVDRVRNQPARPPSAPPQSMTYTDGPARPGSPPMGKPLRGIPRQPERQDGAGWGQPPPPRSAMSPRAGRRTYEPSHSQPMTPPQERRYREPVRFGNSASPPVERKGYRNAPRQGPQYPPKQANQLQPSDYYNVDLQKGATGFGFSIRGGREYDNTPLFVLRMAENGPATHSALMRVGDQLIEINGQITDGMLHSEAISAIRNGGDRISLVLCRSHKAPSMGESVPSMDPRHTAQTPPPTFRGATTTVSKSSLQSDDVSQEEQSGGGRGRGRHTRGEGGRGRGKDNFDYAWNYRSLPRGMKY